MLGRRHAVGANVTAGPEIDVTRGRVGLAAAPAATYHPYANVDVVLLCGAVLVEPEHIPLRGADRPHPAPIRQFLPLRAERSRARLVGHGSLDTTVRVTKPVTAGERGSRTVFPTTTTNRSAASARMTGHDGSNSVARTLNRGVRGWA